MKYTFQALSLIVAALSLTSCPDPSGPGGGAVGPYDAQGNYVEAWADDPSKWRHPARDVAGTTVVAKNDPVPTHMTPLPPSRSPEIILPPSKPVSAPKPPPREIASNTTSRPKTSTSGSSGTRSTSKPKPTVAKTTSKPKPKPAPKTVRHTIKKGETLSGLASKYGTSVSAIQKANGISGSMIREGKSLVIPRKK